MARILALTALVGTACLAAAGQDGEAPPRTSVRLGLLRAVPEKWNLDKNFGAFLELLDATRGENVDIFITPECWLDGYAAPAKDSTRERIVAVAQDLNSSRYLQRVSEEARSRSMWICFGFTSLENGKAYNAAGLWNAEGERVGVYHKTHIQTHDVQFDAGESLPVWPSAWGPLGIMICADRRWPETARVLRLQGAKLILNPTYGFHNELNEAMMRTRAFENQCFIAFAHPEESLVTGPKGEIVAQKKGSRGVLICDIDLSRATDDNHLKDRRPELYGVIVGGE
ncbi:MAG TPA: carbon-nitrogen hydrolase family protein [Candidatus Hydrogenedentes bacterium]|nr:carbon-nitrogen hydrolase family protein [Candidatus Hydrogenedentota bacterium]HQH52074.1 carbon-nitrogen hydrolase family protein [Candidatus Hydrogenedentota bacterium]HQM49762.1 carbon-nitrogen hydrolase family protein [Candidatus Hydrogenedentota bacterium]